MIAKTYVKYCDCARLASEIVTAGLPQYPTTGARFYYVRSDQQSDNSWITTVQVYDDFTAGETTTLDGVVSAHIPTPLPGSPIDVQETTIFNALAIRDTDSHTSAVSNNIGYRVKTLIITNGLNQAVTEQCQGSRDSSIWFNVGDPFTVLANTTVYQTCETYFPYIRALASCTVAPTTGALDMWVEKMGV